MKIAELLKLTTLSLCASLLVMQVTTVNAQSEEEEEEPMQTRPNPMENRMRMKGAERQWDPTDKGSHKGGAAMRNPATRAAPAMQMNRSPQTLQPGMSGPSQMRPGMSAPQLQDDGEHGDMMNPQQMGAPMH